MTVIDNNKKLETLIAKLEESKFDETTIYMISQLNPSWVKKLILCMELVDNFEESIRDMLDEITIDEIDSNKLEYEVTIKPQGFGDTQVYTRQLWL